MASNYEDVLHQLQDGGLLVDSLVIGKRQRCRERDGDREKRGWYHLHELRLPNGNDLIVGSWGIWRGAENNAQKISVRKADMTAEQRENLRTRLAEDRRRADQARAEEAERAAQRAGKAWRQCIEQGQSPYLVRKGVGGHGVRYSPSTGALVIPMLDTAGKVHGLQIIRSPQQGGGKRRLDKEFWPVGLAKKGHFHQFGGVIGRLVLVCEGYATGASLFEATGLPVVVAFDAGNLAAVCAALRKRHKLANVLICADDDAFSTGNPGVTAASGAALAAGGAFVAPHFSDEPARRLAFETSGKKLTDFNDLHGLEGLHVVRAQIEARITALGWRQQATARTVQAGEGANASRSPLRPIDSLDGLLERFALVYGHGGTVFDFQERVLLALSDMRDACLSRDLHRAWAEHPEKQMVRISEVGFDPSESDPEVLCNLFSGWPTTPKAGSCDYLLELLRHMCAGDTRPDLLYDWVLCWLAYPIQHRGAKMKTTVVIHGPQGTGKNLFFEAIMAIYGRYGRVIDQSAIEDKFNDWASRRLFLIADEVVARSDLYHVKNKLKAFITGDWIRINPKNMAAYDERNHVNMVFLSNEAMPVVLEEDDRRHAVIWTPAKLTADFYAKCLHEIANGGVEALHDHLLHLTLGEFGAGTLPPMTDAKRELIDLSLDSPSRFFQAFESGDLGGFPARDAPALLTPCDSLDLFALYQNWCQRVGQKALNQARFSNQLMRKHGAWTKRSLVPVSDIGSKRQVSFTYLPGGHECPQGQNELHWLADRMDIFRIALKDYRGMASA